MFDGKIQCCPVGAGLAAGDDFRNTTHRDIVYTNDGAGVEAEMRRRFHF
jgi:diphthamide biosynthesis methyltransferase